MPAKVATKKKAVAKKAAMPAKKTTTKTTPRKRATGAEGFVCDTCGLSVIVDEWGDVVGAQEIICCDKPMRQRARKAKTPAKK